MADNGFSTETNKAIEEIRRIVNGMTWESKLDELIDYLNSLHQKTFDTALVVVAAVALMEKKDLTEAIVQLDNAGFALWLAARKRNRKQALCCSCPCRR